MDTRRDGPRQAGLWHLQTPLRGVALIPDFDSTRPIRASRGGAERHTSATVRRPESRLVIHRLGVRKFSAALSTASGVRPLASSASPA
jgi:hypothetical protein